MAPFRGLPHTPGSAGGLDSDRDRWYGGYNCSVDWDCYDEDDENVPSGTVYVVVVGEAVCSASATADTSGGSSAPRADATSNASVYISASFVSN